MSNELSYLNYNVQEEPQVWKPIMWVCFISIVVVFIIVIIVILVVVIMIIINIFRKNLKFGNLLCGSAQFWTRSHAYVRLPFLCELYNCQFHQYVKKSSQKFLL